MKKLLLGVDVGTHETKGILVDMNYRPVAEYSVPHQMENPRPNYFEMDAEGVWWSDFCEVTKGLMKKAGIGPENIIGVGVDVMGCDCIPVDENCHPLRKAILYGIDARAEDQIRNLYREFGEERVIEMFGHRPKSDDISTKILWIRDNEPEIYNKTFKFLTGSSYMTAKLTGKYLIDSYLAKGAFRPIYRMDGSYNEKDGPIFCRADQMAVCADVIDVAGGVTKEAAAECGLKEGTPVIVGTGDSTSESIAGGLVSPGTLFMQFGSTMFYIYCTDRQMDACIEDRFPGSGPYTIPGSFAVTGGTNCAGTLTKWVRDVFYKEEAEREKNGGPDAYTIMVQDAAEVEAGSGGIIVLPYLYGERSPIHDPLAKGVIFGLNGNHGRAEINRAALEAVAYSVGSHMKLFAAHGLVPDELIIAGGGTQNPVWMQIVADVTGKPVKVAEKWQTAGYGAACMAAIGCGLLKDFYELKEAMPRTKTVMPDPERHKFYQKYQELYEELYKNTCDLMHRL
ncbi:MAG: FGGY-family carbohydrate kinase [Lachnospiraceae bacterium]|nr:FGGY-family carbohydrate kinase [Lachnospiraceae bacterium]